MLLEEYTGIKPAPEAKLNMSLACTRKLTKEGLKGCLQCSRESQFQHEIAV